MLDAVQGNALRRRDVGKVITALARPTKLIHILLRPTGSQVWECSNFRPTQNVFTHGLMPQ